MQRTKNGQLYPRKDELRKVSGDKLRQLRIETLGENGKATSFISLIEMRSGADFENAAYGQYERGARINLSFLILASQSLDVPLTSLLGDEVHDFERDKILRDNYRHFGTRGDNFFYIQPEHPLGGPHIKTITLAYKIGPYRAGDIVFIDTRVTRFDYDGIYLMECAESAVLCKIIDTQEGKLLVSSPSFNQQYEPKNLPTITGKLLAGFKYE